MSIQIEELPINITIKALLKQNKKKNKIQKYLNLN